MYRIEIIIGHNHAYYHVFWCILYSKGTCPIQDLKMIVIVHDIMQVAVSTRLTLHGLGYSLHDLNLRIFSARKSTLSRSHEHSFRPFLSASWTASLSTWEKLQSQSCINQWRQLWIHSPLGCLIREYPFSSRWSLFGHKLLLIHQAGFRKIEFANLL